MKAKIWQGCCKAKIIEFFQSKVYNQISQGQIRAWKCSLRSRRKKDSNDQRVTCPQKQSIKICDENK